MGLGSNKIELGSDKIELGIDKIELDSDKIELGIDKLELGTDKLELGSGRFEQNRRDATSYKIYMGSNKMTHRMLKQKTMKKTNSR